MESINDNSMDGLPDTSKEEDSILEPDDITSDVPENFRDISGSSQIGKSQIVILLIKGLLFIIA